MNESRHKVMNLPYLSIQLKPSRLRALRKIKDAGNAFREFSKSSPMNSKVSEGRWPNLIDALLQRTGRIQQRLNVISWSSEVTGVRSAFEKRGRDRWNCNALAMINMWDGNTKGNKKNVRSKIEAVVGVIQLCNDEKKERERKTKKTWNSTRDQEEENGQNGSIFSHRTLRGIDVTESDGKCSSGRLDLSLQTVVAFPQYNYREFFKRRIRDHFTAAIKNNEISEVEFHAKCQELLQVIRRQSALYQSYPISKLVVEEKSSDKEFSCDIAKDSS
uniref:Complex1_LYR_dom domain-containing protein n=1 Tax=Elaeophora elaphi TaxID=1147741 RepID=A0A0R3S315_9BILA